MIQASVSPTLGLVWVFTRWSECPTDGRLAFHPSEIAALKACPTVTPEAWKDVAYVKAVWPGAVVTEVHDLVARRARYEKTWAKAARFTHVKAPPVPEWVEETD
jgi:hypothetical protein